jgi:hypothetical protein
LEPFFCQKGRDEKDADMIIFPRLIWHFWYFHIWQILKHSIWKYFFKGNTSDMIVLYYFVYGCMHLPSSWNVNVIIWAANLLYFPTLKLRLELQWIFKSPYLFPIWAVNFIWEHLFRICYNKNHTNRKDSYEDAESFFLFFAPVSQKFVQSLLWNEFSVLALFWIVCWLQLRVCSGLNF